MVWRMIMRYLVNNEHLIERLSQSGFMRRAAQLTVYFTLKYKDIGQNSINNILKSDLMKQMENNKNVSTTRIKTFSERFMSELKTGLKDMENDLKKKR